jgi:fructose-bisphosphate aldolase class I
MTAQLRRTALALVSGGRGILAIDESPRALSARLEQAGVLPTAEHRRAYRQLLVTTPDLYHGINAVILSGETFGQRLDSGVPFPHAISELGMLPGIKMDTATTPLAGAPGETVTEGLDNLRDRLAYYVDRGARFAKWRAVFRIDEQRPTERALRANAYAIARYGALCHEIGIVAIVESEVLADGRHTIRTCAEVTSMTLLLVMRELHDAGVDPAGVVLRSSLVVPGLSTGYRAEPDEIAERTVRALQLVVSADLAGVAFLSGSQRPATAIETLAALQYQGAPWPLTFGFGRLLVDPALAAWRGDPARIPDGQHALAQRVDEVGAAVRGPGMTVRPRLATLPHDDPVDGLD